MESIAAWIVVASKTMPRRRPSDAVSAIGAIALSRPEIRRVSTSEGLPSSTWNATFTPPKPSSTGLTVVSTVVL
jgi:hypothetical protein